MLCNERDFTTSLSDYNQADTIEAFNSTSRYLDDLVYIGNPYFAGVFNQMYRPELQMNRADTSDTEVPFWICIYLFLTVLFGPTFMISSMTDFNTENFLFLDGDFPRRTSHGVYGIFHILTLGLLECVVMWMTSMLVINV